MKYIKTFENINKVNKRLGLYVDPEQIFYIINYLKGKNIKFILLFGSDDDDADEDCFLILIEGDDYKNLDHITYPTNNFKDYYIRINGDSVFLNWFPDVIEGDWQIIKNMDKENIENIITAKKFNI